jgi:hypothetical protein
MSISISQESGPAVDRIRTGVLVLAIAGCVAAAALAVRLGGSLEASERSLARAEERIRALESEAEVHRAERARLADELRGSRSELALLRAALAIGSAEQPDGVAELPDLLDAEEAAAANDAASAAPEPIHEALPDPPPPDPQIARRQREEIFGAHAPAVETMLALHAEERFAELAALADAEIARHPDFTFAWVQGGLAYVRLGEVERARERLVVARDRAQDGDARLLPYYRAAWFALEDIAP